MRSAIPIMSCWLNHTMREYYDQWDAFSAPLRWKGRIKEAHPPAVDPWADRLAVDEERPEGVHDLADGHRTPGALGRHQVRAAVSAPASAGLSLRRLRATTCSLCRGSRRSSGCRCCIEALANPEAAGIRCVIAGEGEEHGSLEHAIATRGLSSRVKLIGRIDDRQMLEHLARCRAVCFPPYDEDYGFVTVEAFASRKPVITCTDSGGPAELVTDNVNGKVCAPRPETLAVALREVMEDPPPPNAWDRPDSNRCRE